MTQILLIDLSGIAHPIWHTSQGSTNPNECSIQTVAKVRALASGQPHVAVCCDSGRSFRRDVAADYKAQRPEADATLMHQIALAVETLKADGFPVWAVKGFEADDVLASAVAWTLAHTAWEPTSDPDLLRNRAATTEIPDAHVLIASSDKDMLQLVSDRVSIHRVADTKKATTVTPEVVRAEYGIEPSQFTEWLMLVGDSSDNIKGAEGIGPKTATAMLAKYGNLADFYAAFDADATQFKPGTVKAMTEFRPRMETVRALVTLRTDGPLPFDEVFKERVPADVAVFGGTDGDEDMGGLGTAVGGPAVVRDQGQNVDHGGTAAANGHHGGGVGSRDEGTGADSSGVRAGGTQESTATTDSGVRQQQTVQSVVSATSGSGGLAVRDVEVLPPPSADFSMQLEPRSLHQAIDLAKHMHASRLFSAYGTPQAVLSTIMAGRELGLQSQAALRAFHIIEGKPAFSADLIRALCRKSPLCEYFRLVERSDTKATWVTKRRGDPEFALTYTIEEGRRAWQKDQKAWDASGWGRRPANMVTKTASSTLARLVYDDVVLNMYCVEELTGEERD
jgi:5'-3' exonuclease